MTMGGLRMQDRWIALIISLGVHIAAGIVVWNIWGWTETRKPEMPVELALQASPARSPEEKPVEPLQQASVVDTGPSNAAVVGKAPEAQATEAKQEAPPAVSQPPKITAPPEKVSGLQAPEDLQGDSGKALLPPRLREKPELVMPAEAARLGASGAVLLTVEVLEDGRVGKIALSRTSGSALLDSAAREHIAKWRFEPARQPQGGKAVRVLTSVWVIYAKEGS